MSWSRVSFANWSTISLPSMLQWLGTQQKRTRVPLSLSAQRRFMIWQMRGFSVSSPWIACRQDIDHNGDNQSVVLGTRYGIWWPWYGQFKVGWLQPLQLWLGAGTSSVAPVLVSQDRDLCHVQLHSTWFEPTSECRSWPVVSYMYSGHLPVGLYLGRGSILLVGPLFHFRQCHSGLVPSRNEHVCHCHSMTRAGSWYGK